MMAKGGIRGSSACTAARLSGEKLYVLKVLVRLGAELLRGVAGAAPEPPAAAAWLLARSMTFGRAGSSGQAESCSAARRSGHSKLPHVRRQTSTKRHRQLMPQSLRV